MNPATKHPLVSAAVAAAILLAPVLLGFATRIRRRLRPWVLEVPPVLLLLAAAVYAYRPLIHGDMPTSWDHNFQILKGLEASARLRHLSLFGWSDRESAGFPESVNYPLLGAFLTAAVHAVTRTSWQTAYSWCLLLQVLAWAFALFFAGRIHYGRLAGTLAGLFGLFDPGGLWEGGAYSTLVMGMWIQSFATAFLLAGLALWPLAITNGKRGWAAAAGVLLGIGVLFHPQTLVIGGIASVLMVAALLSDQALPLPRIAGGTAYIAGLALAICAWWLVPYLTSTSVQSFPTFGLPDSRMAWGDILHGDTLRLPALWLGAGLVGLLLLAGRRDAFSRFVALTVPLLLVVFSTDPMAWLRLRLPDHPGLADELQLTRLHYLVRPLGMLATAYALSRGWRRMEAWGRQPGWRAIPARALVALVAVALLQFEAVHLPAALEDTPKGITGDDRVYLERALARAAAELGPEDRVALRSSDWVDHSMVLPASLLGLKLEVLGGDAAILFKNRFATDDVTLLGRIGCTVLVAKGPQPTSLTELPLIAEFGPFAVRRIPRQPRVWIERGTGQVAVQSWQDEEIHVHISEASPEAVLGVGLAYYDAWQSEGNGPRLFPLDEPSSEDQPPDTRNQLTQLRAHPGDLTLVYRAPKMQRVSMALSVFGILGFAGVPWLRRRRLSA